MFHLDQQPTDSNLWPDQPSDRKQLENQNGEAPLDTHLTPLTDVPDEEEEEDDTTTSPSSKSNDDKKQKRGDPEDQSATEKEKEMMKEKKDVAEKRKDPPPTADNDPVVVNGANSPEHGAPSALATSSPGESNPAKNPTSPAPSTPARSASPSKSDFQSTETNGLDPRVSVLLDINTELLRTYIEFQSRNLHQSTECQAYITRLQSNLNWLAGSMDKNTGPVPILPLPTFEAPPTVKFTDREKVEKLYAQLPSLFARDVDRRQRLKLKRERAPDDNGPNAHKRQDTGNSKLSTVPTSQAQAQTPSNVPNGITQHSPSPTNHSQPNFVARQPSVEISQTPRMTAAPDLQRANQIRQMSHSHSTPPLSGGPAGSPPHPGPSQTPSMSDMQHRSSSNPVQPYAQSPLNPAIAVQVTQILQDPHNQPFVKFLLARDPQFHTRPPNIQLQQLQLIQQQLRRQQQAQAQARLSGQPSAGGLQQSPVVPSGGMNPGFPSSANPQGQSFPSQMAPGSGPIAPYPNGVASNSMQPPATTSRPGSSHHVLAGQNFQNLQNLTPPQRQQLFLIQQQQRMGGMNTPQRPGPQGFQYQQQSPQHGSPPVFPDSSGDQQVNPGLSVAGSNVPGIAKTSRSPSVPIPSPVKGQGSFVPDGYPQVIAMATGQHLPLQQTQLSQMALQQGQINNQQVPKQGWPSNMNNMNMGMNPAAFQLSAGNTSGQQPGGVPIYVNPSSLGVGPPGQQQAMNTGVGPNGWPSQSSHNAGSPVSSVHDSAASRRASATPAPSQMGPPLPFDPSNPYPAQWSS